jgi:hypothetical protein
MVVDRPLGEQVHDLCVSAGLALPPEAALQRLNWALGTWIRELRLVIVDVGHPKHQSLDETSLEAVIARIAWHEWGHALSLDRATELDVADGSRLLSTAPAGIAKFVRAGGYGPSEYTHELVAEVYALLMARRRRGESEKPEWLTIEIWSLIVRVTGWSDRE